MPIYEYVCEQCDEKIEIIQKITDLPISRCPNCQSNALRKKTSISAFRLKGSGWYKDGYNDANVNENHSDDKPTETESSSTDNKTETKKSSESKPDATSTPATTTSESTSTAAG